MPSKRSPPSEAGPERKRSTVKRPGRSGLRSRFSRSRAGCSTGSRPRSRCTPEVSARSQLAPLNVFFSRVLPLNKDRTGCGKPWSTWAGPRQIPERIPRSSARNDDIVCGSTVLARLQRSRSSAATHCRQVTFCFPSSDAGESVECAAGRAIGSSKWPAPATSWANSRAGRVVALDRHSFGPALVGRVWPGSGRVALGVAPPPACRTGLRAGPPEWQHGRGQCRTTTPVGGGCPCPMPARPSSRRP